MNHFGIWPLILASAVTLGAPAKQLERPVNIEIESDWTIRVSAGVMNVAGTRITIPRAQYLKITNISPIQVRDEVHERIPEFNPNTGGWMKGARLKRLIADECTVPGSLVPGSFRLKPQPGPSQPFEQGEDYLLDEEWGTFGRVVDGKVAPAAVVYADYDYTPSRWDTLAVSPDGRCRVVRGTEGVGRLFPPSLRAGEIAFGTVYLPRPAARLNAEHLYLITLNATPVGAPVAERLLPRTLQKLRDGAPLKVLAFGDSVTAGGYPSLSPQGGWQYQFVAKLKQRFPSAQIELTTTAQGGATSAVFTDTIVDGRSRFEREVVDKRADLVIIEFVNDAGLDQAGVDRQYGRIIDALQQAGAEVILTTPHLVRPDWMGQKTARFTTDPRPYTAALKAFGAARGVAVADAAAGWVALQKRGIPYMALLGNNINHPDDRGMEILADTLLGLFPTR